MKVLQFAFDPEGDSIEMPHNHPNNVVAYTGTHDNDTILGWYENETTKESRAFLDKYSNRREGKRSVMLFSVCSLVHLPLWRWLLCRTYLVWMVRLA